MIDLESGLHSCTGRNIPMRYCNRLGRQHWRPLGELKTMKEGYKNGKQTHD